MDFLQSLKFGSPFGSRRIRVPDEEDEEEKETLITPYHIAVSQNRSRRTCRKFEVFLMVTGGASLLFVLTLLAIQGVGKFSSDFEGGWKTEIGM